MKPLKRVFGSLPKQCRQTHNFQDAHTHCMVLDAADTDVIPCFSLVTRIGLSFCGSSCHKHPIVSFSFTFA